MLGYSSTDIVDMQIAINDAKKQLNPNLLTTPETMRGLDKAWDLLQGLIMEGHINA